MVTIRLSMYGRLKAPFYRIVATTAKSRREGKPLEVLGFYNPAKKDLKIDKEKVGSWVKKGAQVSSAVKKLLETKTK